VHRLGLGDPELRDLYQQADVFCLPTYGDAVPFSVVEAMACGAAVVATPVGAIPELIDGAGRLVPPGDPRALREAVLALAGDAAARSAHGTAGRARCEARYDAVVQGHRLVEILHDAAGR
jgi:glycosyltransferase involved in cell wall biosynthesis